MTRKAHSLRYMLDDVQGISRKKRGQGFVYIRPDGKPMRKASEVKRIRELAIPPAWKNVWISPVANSHLQATGFDARGRKQYLYHPRWREVRDEAKYDRILSFGKELPRIRRQVKRDLAKRGLHKEKVVAAIVSLMESTLIRVGNEEYARSNHSYGLTTMRDRHARIRGSKVTFQFLGKSKKTHEISLDDPRLVRVVKNCQDLPGQRLFQYIDEEAERREVSSTDVNEYLRELTTCDFTAKDFRTWAGTVLAALALQKYDKFDSEPEAKRQIKEAIESVARELGNTAAICRSSYIHPVIVESYLAGDCRLNLKGRGGRKQARARNGLSSAEAAVLTFLRKKCA